MPRRFVAFFRLRGYIKGFDIIHLHFGGFDAALLLILTVGLRVKRVITFHGTDLHGGASLTEVGLIKRMKARLGVMFSLVSYRYYDDIRSVSLEIIPKSFNRNLFRKESLYVKQRFIDSKVPLKSAIKFLRLEDTKRYILFSNISGSKNKRIWLARSIINKAKIQMPELELLVLSDEPYTRVPYYLSASIGVIITSVQEGSPNIVREALSYEKRIFSMNVGDVSSYIQDLKGSCIIPENIDIAAQLIIEALGVKIDEAQYEQKINNILEPLEYDNYYRFE